MHAAIFAVLFPVSARLYLFGKSVCIIVITIYIHRPTVIKCCLSHKSIQGIQLKLATIKSINKASVVVFTIIFTTAALLYVFSIRKHQDLEVWHKIDLFK